MTSPSPLIKYLVEVAEGMKLLIAGSISGVKLNCMSSSW